MLRKLLIILIFTFQLYAQNNKIAFDRYADAQGVHIGPVVKILQDSRGFLWFAGWFSLYRYDGYTFTPMLDVSYGFISAICEDKSGNIWAGTFLGLVKIDAATGEKTQYKPYSSGRGTEWSNRVLSVLEDKNGILWVGTADGLFKYDAKARQFTGIQQDIDEPDGISSNVINDIFEDKKGQLWFATGNGLEKYDRDSNKFIHYFNIKGSPNNFGSQVTNDNWINCITQDQNGNLWIGTRAGLMKFHPELNIFTIFKNDPKNTSSISSNNVTSLAFDSSGTLWVCTDYGINTYEGSGNTFSHYINDKNDPASLSNNSALSVICEKSGTIWVGTYYGLNKLNRKKQPFTKIFDDNIQVIINGGSEVFYFWVQDGLKRYDTKSKVLKDLSYDEYLTAVDNRGNLWFNKYGGGLISRDSNNKITQFYFPLGKAFNFWVTCVYNTRENNIYIGTATDGLFYIDPLTNEIMHIIKSKVFINVIYEDKYGLLWVGTANAGLYCFKKNREFVKHYIFNQEDPETVSFTTILDINEDKNGNLWFGGNTGLNRFDHTAKKFKHLDNNIGSLHPAAFTILEDNKGRIWSSSQHGVACYDPENDIFKNYDFTYGLPAGGLADISGYKNKSGEMFFGGQNGLYQFHPDNIEDNLYIPPVVISTFKIFNEDVKLDTVIFNKKSIHLKYSDNSLSFEFAALNFVSPGKNQYAYKLEGFEKDWVYSGGRRYVSYSNLDPGTYVFRVKASNNDGIWNEEGSSLAIIISPPWWKTWWAYISYILLFGFSLYGLRRYELNRASLKNQVKTERAVLKEREETDKMKSRFFANISHEFRTPLTLIIGPAEKIISDTSDDIKKDAAIIKRNSRRLLQLINQLLDLSKLEAGRLKLEATCSNIVSFVKGVTLSFESLSESKDITLKLNSEKEFIELYFDKEKMMKILTNILSNAFKFTPEEGTITVAVKEVNSILQIRIKDTGIGIPPEELPRLFDRFYQVDSTHTREYEGTGIGLALTKELAELHHGTIKVQSEQKESGSWTEFILEFPLGKNHLNKEEIVQDTPEISKTEPIPELVVSLDQLKDNIDNKNESEEKTIILVVEDNYDMREYIKDSLNKKEYQIEEAVNGEQGARKAEKIIPDLIISDLMMPKMDGNQLVELLKNNEKTSHIPIILLTAKAGQENKLEGLETGADDYLTKPFDIKELQVRVKNLISIRKKLQEKYSRFSEPAVKPDQKEIIKENIQKLKSIDEKFLLKVGDIIEKHIAEEGFNVEDFCDEVGMSRNQVHRKLKALTGKSASLYIRTVKLNKAKRLIVEQTATISEIAYSLGFSSPAYFTKCFREEFGYPPSSEIKSQNII